MIVGLRTLCLFVLLGMAVSSLHAVVVPVDVKNLIAFVFLADAAGKPGNPSGSAFFVSVPNEANAEISHCYVVTAKHVLTDDAGELRPQIFLRLNKLGGGVGFVPVQVGGGHPAYRHPQDSRDKPIDLVVVSICPDRKVFDYKLITPDFFADRQWMIDNGVSEGSEGFFEGMLANFQGQNRNYPVLRWARLALLLEEPIPWIAHGRSDVPQELYLFETFSFGGNSGAPVFFYLGPDHRPGLLSVGPPKIKLAGVMSGTMLHRFELLKSGSASPKHNQAGPIYLPYSSDNTGIAGVVPASLLQEILFSDRLVQDRANSMQGK